MKRRLVISFLIFFGINANAELPKVTQTLIIIGDQSCAKRNSSGAEMEGLSSAGWGEIIEKYFNDDIMILDKGRSGRSTKSFISEGRWDAASTFIQKGNVVMIQFGHNDEKKEDPARYTSPYGEYTRNLTYFINMARRKGAIPILLTPVARDFFVDGKLQDTHGEYPEAMREVAKKTGCYLIDLTKLTFRLYASLGEKQAALHFHVEEGDKNLQSLGTSRHSVLGADTVAKLIIDEVRRQDIKELTEYLK